MLEIAPNLTDQIYDALVEEICAGRLAAGTHLVQEKLAARFGVSRQPIQQVMSRLKADGMVEELGRRGLFVAPLDPERMRQHYGIRAALDGWAAKQAAARTFADPALAASLRAKGAMQQEAAEQAAAAGNSVALMRQDDAFHFMLYAAAGNPMLASTAEPHWRFLRRAMVDVLRQAERPETIWSQHGAILEAVLAGDGAAAERLAVDHVQNACELLASALEKARTEGTPHDTNAEYRPDALGSGTPAAGTDRRSRS
ncbi:GntR family transcriptional regulator [Nisaea acidiphila]|uniref:GntR family transcriptional regulator n=1 Tax=Nisaea acidiphila TaxID=1862145 RepID=A0A9J7AV24_9PROT|nr:GntR family transcriptional regulator [Nisaea acidiphila]UUX49261.1 GntR family transcriptional regulator [Nisaea acidiphila]